MKPSIDQISINPLQWVATADGWIDPSSAPALDTRMEFISSAGIRGLHTDVPDGLSVSDYASMLEKHGLRAAPGYISALLTDDAAEQAVRLDRAKTIAETHAELGIPVVFLAMGMAHGAPRVERPAVGFDFDADRLSATRDLIEEFAEIVSGFGVTPALHQHVGTWIESDAETRFVLDSVSPEVLAFGPDIGHLAWAGADPVALIRDYSERVVSLHIKDYHESIAIESKAAARTYRQTVQAGIWAEPGHGSNDISQILSAVPDDFAGWFVIEVDKGAQETPEESVRLCGEWALQVTQ